MALPHACDGLLALAKEFLSPRHWVLRRRRHLEDWKGCYRVTQNSVDGFQPVSLPTEGRILHENLVNRLCFAGSQDVPTSHGDFTICSNSLERCKAFNIFCLSCVGVILFEVLVNFYSRYFDNTLSISQFLMFELAQKGDGAAVQEIMAKAREMGVDLEDFLKTLLGK